MESIKYVGLLHRSSIIIINIMYESRKFSKKITFWTMFSIFRCSSEDNRERERGLSCSSHIYLSIFTSFYLQIFVAAKFSTQNLPQMERMCRGSFSLFACSCQNGRGIIQSQGLSAMEVFPSGNRVISGTTNFSKRPDCIIELEISSIH